MVREADFYSPGEAAKLLGLSELTVLGLLTSGQLEGHQDERARWRIPASVVDRAVQNRQQETDRAIDPMADTVVLPPAGLASGADTPRGEGTTRENSPTYRDDEQSAETTADAVEDIRGESGWVTTAQAARALRITPRTVRWHIEHGNLAAKPQGEGVQRTWLVSVDSLHAFRNSRQRAQQYRGNVRGDGDRAETTNRAADASGSAADTTAKLPLIDPQETIRTLSERLADIAAEAGELRGRLELTETTESTLREQLERERQRADEEKERAERFQAALEAERSKGFWRRLFGG